MSAVLAKPQVKDFLKTLAKGKEKGQEQRKEHNVNAHAVAEEGEPSKKPWEEDIPELSSPSYSPPTSFSYSSDSSSSSNPRRRTCLCRYLAPRPVTIYRDRICVDGGLTSFMPPTAAQSTVRVCVFPAAQLGLRNIGISPDCSTTEGRASPRQLLNWALEPAADDTLENLFDLGYQDALVWVSAYEGTLAVRPC
ncbi:hypothetical protein L7F22_054394 [Adiantum nelumboides]|nr:hypothetical protein [Adiantum nelumboides]